MAAFLVRLRDGTHAESMIRIRTRFHVRPDWSADGASWRVMDKVNRWCDRVGIPPEVYASKAERVDDDGHVGSADR